MGIEPIESSRQISDLGCLRDPSAMDVRIFTVRGALYGNVRQVLHNGPSSRRVSQTLMTARDPLLPIVNGNWRGRCICLLQSFEILHVAREVPGDIRLARHGSVLAAAARAQAECQQRGIQPAQGHVDGYPEGDSACAAHPYDCAKGVPVSYPIALRL
jgi:hypothetical protein